jgi:hypothetical protein
VAQLAFTDLMNRLHKDEGFRRQFAAAPAKTLQENGLDPDLLSLPAHLDYAELTDRLNHVYKGPAADTAPAGISADQLWKRFGVIGLSKEANSQLAAAGDDPPPLVSIVIYGASIVTAPVVVAGKEGGLRDVDQLQTLRNLSQHSRDKLSFSVSGPNGLKAQNVSADMMSAFLKRVK